MEVTRTGRDIKENGPITWMTRRGRGGARPSKRGGGLGETKRVDKKARPASLPVTTVRYQFGNHLGTACLELDENADVITYEEYYPYGSTSYQAGRTLAEVSLKRYRYIGKERD